MQLPELHFRQYSDEVISHQHDEHWQVVCALSGEMEINMDRQHFLLSMGSGMVIPPSVSHAFSGRIGNQNYVLEMPATAQWALNEKISQFTLTPAANSLLSWLHRFPQPPEHSFTVAQLLFAQLKTDNRWIDELIKWINSRLHLPLSCQDIASAFYMSISTLQRKVKAETQLTLMQLLLQKRMEAAGRLLLANLSIEQTAFSIGYESHSAFSHAFRQYYGKSPTDYRARLLNISTKPQ